MRLAREPQSHPRTGAQEGDRRQMGKDRFPELRHLIGLARNAWSRGRRPWLATVTGTIPIAVWLLLRNPTIGRHLWHWGAVSAALPVPTELARLPLSVFLPTPYLPLWGAVLQIVVVLGLAELVLGRWMTVAMAALGHFAATLAVRVMIDVFHSSLFGLSPSLAHVVDTGPSAAVTAVGAYLLLVTGMKRCTGLLCLGLLIAALAMAGLDGPEHLVAVACGLSAALVARHVFRRPASVATVPRRRTEAAELTARAH